MRTRPQIKPKIFLSVSAIGFYGDRKEELLTEGSAQECGFLTDVCRKWEAAASEAKKIGSRVAIFRLGHVLGNGGLLKKIIVPFEYGFGGAWGDGQQWMSWIHVQDSVNIFELALENPSLEGVYNAVTPNPVRNLEFSKCLAEKFQRKLFINIPPLIIKLLFGEMSDVIFSSQRVIPENLNRIDFQFQFSKLNEAIKSISF